MFKHEAVYPLHGTVTRRQLRPAQCSLLSNHRRSPKYAGNHLRWFHMLDCSGVVRLCNRGHTETGLGERRLSVT